VTAQVREQGQPPKDPAAPAPGRQGPLLRVENVGKRFGEIVALKDVSVEVARGEVLGVAGPNGAGKTTLFNVIAGRYSGTGHVFLEGENTIGMKPHQLCHRGVARTFQIPLLFSSLSVEDNVRVGAQFGGRSRHDRQAAVDEGLTAVGMNERRGWPASQLNLLGKKLTMVAAALATAPRLLLLDEPMGGLAPTEIKVLGELVRRLNKESGITIIVIEHLVRKLVELSDRLMILSNGERIALGAPLDVVNDARVIELYLGTADYA
jgi:branched-chain amino acid transport system ATP-binding protein